MNEKNLVKNCTVSKTIECLSLADLKPYPKIDEIQKCKIHNLESSVMCKGCHVCVCCECFYEQTHLTHTIIKIKDYYSKHFDEDLVKLKKKAEDYIEVLDENSDIQNEIQGELDKINANAKLDLISEFTRFVNNSEFDYDSSCAIKQYRKDIKDVKNSIVSSCKLKKKYEVYEDAKLFEKSFSKMQENSESVSLKNFANSLERIGEHKMKSIFSDEFLISFKDFQKMQDEPNKKSGEKRLCSALIQVGKDHIHMAVDTANIKNILSKSLLFAIVSLTSSDNKTICTFKTEIEKKPENNTLVVKAKFNEEKKKLIQKKLKNSATKVALTLELLEFVANKELIENILFKSVVNNFTSEKKYNKNMFGSHRHSISNLSKHSREALLRQRNNTSRFADSQNITISNMFMSSQASMVKK